MTNIDIGGYKLWKKFCLVLALLSLLSLPVFSESEAELKIPELEPEATYEIQGKDLITLYTTIDDLNETKNEWKNLTTETMKTSKDALELAKEYERENKKLTIKNKFLVGGVCVSVGVSVGALILLCTK